MTKILKLHFITFFFLLTPVIHAAESVRKRYEEEIPKGGSLVAWASRPKPEEIANRLRAGRISPNLQDDDGATLIIWAAHWEKNEQMTKLLIELNANPDLQDCDGNSALLHATQNDADNEIHRNILKLLLKDSDIYSQNYEKRKKSCTYTPIPPSFREMVLEETNRRKQRTVEISPFLIHELMHKRDVSSEITPSEIADIILKMKIAAIILEIEGSKPVESRALVNPADLMVYARPNGLRVFVGDDDIDVFMDHFVDNK